MSHVTYVNESCPLHRNSVSRMSHAIHINESWHVYMSHVISECITTHTYPSFSHLVASPFDICTVSAHCIYIQKSICVQILYKYRHLSRLSLIYIHFFQHESCHIRMHHNTYIRIFKPSRFALSHTYSLCALYLYLEIYLYVDSI